MTATATAVAARRVLIVNPNCTPAITALLRARARAYFDAHGAAGTPAGTPADAVDIDAVTARFGGGYISSEASYAIAAHALLDAYATWVAEHGAEPDATLIGCFGDPGLHALREHSLGPVNGLAEAAFREAAAIGRFVVVTGGSRWRPMLERLAASIDLGDRLAGIHTVAPTGAQLVADPAGARAVLLDACRDALRETRADAAIIGGAGLAGIAAELQPMVAAPLIDSVDAGIRAVLATLHSPVKPDASMSTQPPNSWFGLSPALQAWMHDKD